MIHYHGLPITPESAASEILLGGHAMVSFANPDQIELAAEACQSFCFDNGAFSAWKSGEPILDWSGYYAWVENWRQHPAFDWAIIPDVVDGDEAANDALLAEWPWDCDGVPVWHLHESLDRLDRLCAAYPRIALGSSGEWPDPGAPRWWERIAKAMDVACDDQGRPRARMHGLRMLDPAIFHRLPLASADSTNVARNIGIDSAWSGPYLIPTNIPASSRKQKAIYAKLKAWRGILLAERTEIHSSASYWVPIGKQRVLAWLGGDSA